MGVQDLEREAMTSSGGRAEMAVRAALRAVAVAGIVAVAAGPGAPAFAEPGGAGERATAHWQVAFRSFSSHSNELETVAAISPGDAWAAGFTTATGSHVNPPVLHWDRARWRPVLVPGTSGTNFADVAASSSDDVWISAANLDLGTDVVRRWDGQRWHSVPPPPGNGMVRVVLGPTDAWAEGPQFCVRNMKHCHTLLAHWNGQSWSQFMVPTFVDQMSGSASGNVWVVGEFGGDPTPPAIPGRPVSFRWDGKSWQPVTSMPHPLSFFPASIAVTSPRNVWLSAQLATSSGPGPGYALHWNGRRWHQITAPAKLHTFGPVLPDGSGAWLGADAHWTGTQWINTTPGPSFAGGRPAGIDGMALVPGTASIWGVGSLTDAGTTFNSLVAIYGSIP